MKLKSERGIIFRDEEKPNPYMFVPEDIILDMMRNYMEGGGGKIKIIDLMLPLYEIKGGENWWYVIPK